MNNKQVGIIITSFSVILGLIVFFFNRALTQIVRTSCDHGASCPMWGSISFHTNITIFIMIIILLIGLYFIFFGDKPIKIKNPKKNIPDNLNADEKQILNIVMQEEGAIFQSTLVEKTGLSKVKITRILDKLEGKNLIERKRRGMTNVIILKH